MYPIIIAGARAYEARNLPQIGKKLRTVNKCTVFSIFCLFFNFHSHVGLILVCEFFFDEKMVVLPGFLKITENALHNYSHYC